MFTRDACGLAAPAGLLRHVTSVDTNKGTKSIHVTQQKDPDFVSLGIILSVFVVFSNPYVGLSASKTVLL
jgi:hypothetical protein